MPACPTSREVTSRARPPANHGVDVPGRERGIFVKTLCFRCDNCHARLNFLIHFLCLSETCSSASVEVSQLSSIQYGQTNGNTTGICSGKSSIADYLVKEHHFKRLFLERTAPTPSVEKSATHTSIPRAELLSDVPRFEHAGALVDFVTKRWQQRWVTTDIWDVSVLDVLQRRPFFLLVSVDAPVSVRWERIKAR
jgi:hypothetical protein